MRLFPTSTSPKVTLPPKCRLRCGRCTESRFRKFHQYLFPGVLSPRRSPLVYKKKADGLNCRPSALYHRFKKNNADQGPGVKRNRSAGSLENTSGPLSAFRLQANKRLVASLRAARLVKQTLSASATQLEPYPFQHTMLHALDCLVKRSMDTARSNAVSTLGPEGGLTVVAAGVRQV